MIFDEGRHEPIRDKIWNEEVINSVIEDIFNETVSRFDSKSFWLAHPDEDGTLSCNKCLYFGAAGILWALDHISSYLNQDLPFDKENLIEDIYDQYLQFPDTEEVVPSLLIGEVGILLLRYRFHPSDEIENRLFEVILENVQNKTLESLWGASGTMLGASYMYDWTHDEKWSELFVKNAEFLIGELKASILRDEGVWTQDMYGQKRRFVGAGHGYFGNIFGILKQLDLLPLNDQDFILSHIQETIARLAIVENDLVNWPPIIPTEDEMSLLVQWCHGSPGVLTSLKCFPKGRDANLEKLMLSAGELVWIAGPLNKGVSLCHGTDGNGFAFLQLYERTGNRLWLDRARQFAMHAIEQRRGRLTLYTGELGLAMYLIACIKEDERFPILDFL